MAEYSLLSKYQLERGGTGFKDLFQSMFSIKPGKDEDEY
jgi:hypothetical protein